jgi:hypothetical protein
MTDQTAEAARLMKVTEAVVEELARQGVLEVMADEGFDPVEMARTVIHAAEGDGVPLKRAPRLIAGSEQLGPQLDQLDGRLFSVDRGADPAAPYDLSRFCAMVAHYSDL